MCAIEHGAIHDLGNGRTNLFGCESERKAQGEILEKLVKVGPLLTESEIQQLSKAMERTQRAHREDKSLPTADEARAFFAEVKAIVDKH